MIQEKMFNSTFHCPYKLGEGEVEERKRAVQQDTQTTQKAPCPQQF